MPRARKTDTDEDLPQSVERRLWRLPKQDPSKAYSTHRPSPLIVEVLEQGSKVLGRVRVKKAEGEHGEFHIENGWLVVRTFPQRVRADEVAAENHRQETLQKAAAARAPAFRRFLAALEDELGPYEKRRECDVTVYAFEPPSRRRCAALLKQARAAGATGSLVDTGPEIKLLITPGGAHRTAAFFGWSTYGPGNLEPALEALDADAGLTVNEVVQDDAFWITLDRVPRDIDQHVEALSAALRVPKKDLAAGLAKKKLTARY
jgi:hypothetical protein